MTRALIATWITVAGLAGYSLTPLPAVASQEIVATGPTISVGQRHACAITEQGDVRCWGDNTFGQLMSPGPSNIKFTQISSGALHSCAVSVAQEVKCWGWQRNTNVPIDLGSVTKVVSGGDSSCAVNLDGKVACWGSGRWANSVQRIPAGADVATTTDHTCVLGAVGSVSCNTGHNGSYTLMPLNLAGGMEIRSGTNSRPYYPGKRNTFCVIGTNQLLTCWGNTNLGDASRDAKYQVPSDLGAVNDVSIGGASICAITAVKRLRCWGEFGDGFSNLVQVTQVALGSENRCVIHNFGQVMCGIPNQPEDIGTSTKILTLEGVLQKFQLSSEPNIIGNVRVGVTLKPNVGNWFPAPKHEFKWYKAERNGIEVEVGNKHSYIVQPYDLGFDLFVRVYASRQGFLTMSAESGRKRAEQGVLRTSATPKISRSIYKNHLTVMTGKWQTGTELSIKWLRNGKPIFRASRSSYKLTATDKGKKITVRVTGTQYGYKPLSKTSNPITIK